MLGIAMLVASCVVMFKVAEAEDRSGLVWAGLTLLACLGCSALIPLPFVGVAVGLVASFAAMFALNLFTR